MKAAEAAAAAAATAGSSSGGGGRGGGHTAKPPPSAPRHPATTAGADASKKPQRPVSAPPSMQTALHHAHRSPRAAGRLVKAFHDVSQGEDNDDDDDAAWAGGDGDGDGDVDGFDGFDGDGAAMAVDDRSNRARVDWDVDHVDRDADWSHMSSANDGRVAHGPASLLLPPGTAGGAKATGGRPYVEAPNETVARRRVPHVNKWPQTDPHKALLTKKYKVALNNVKTSKEEYGLFNKDLAKLAKKEAQMRERTEERLQSELQRRAKLLVAQRHGLLR